MVSRFSKLPDLKVYLSSICKEPQENNNEKHFANVSFTFINYEC